MRDFRNAKDMARALRDALKAKAIETSHSEALELIAKAFGYESWNICPPRSKPPNRSQAMSAVFRPVARATATGSEPIRRTSPATTSPTLPGCEGHRVSATEL
jgi:hypothetical protein